MPVDTLSNTKTAKSKTMRCVTKPSCGWTTSMPKWLAALPDQEATQQAAEGKVQTPAYKAKGSHAAQALHQAPAVASTATSSIAPQLRLHTEHHSQTQSLAQPPLLLKLTQQGLRQTGHRQKIEPEVALNQVLLLTETVTLGLSQQQVAMQILMQRMGTLASIHSANIQQVCADHIPHPCVWRHSWHGCVCSLHAPLVSPGVANSSQS